MQILILILLAVIAAMLYKKFLPANSSDWLVLEWHKLDAAKSMWDNKVYELFLKQMRNMVSPDSTGTPPAFPHLLG